MSQGAVEGDGRRAVRHANGGRRHWPAVEPDQTAPDGGKRRRQCHIQRAGHDQPTAGQRRSRPQPYYDPVRPTSRLRRLVAVLPGGGQDGAGIRAQQRDPVSGRHGTSGQHPAGPAPRAPGGCPEAAGRRRGPTRRLRPGRIAEPQRTDRPARTTPEKGIYRVTSITPCPPNRT